MVNILANLSHRPWRLVLSKDDETSEITSAYGSHYCTLSSHISDSSKSSPDLFISSLLHCHLYLSVTFCGITSIDFAVDYVLSNLEANVQLIADQINGIFFTF